MELFSKLSKLRRRIKLRPTINIRTKCNTKMKQLTENYSIRLNKKQHETLQILKTYNVNISNFIRLAIKEKIQRDWNQIKEKKEKIKLPF